MILYIKLLLQFDCRIFADMARPFSHLAE